MIHSQNITGRFRDCQLQMPDNYGRYDEYRFTSLPYDIQRIKLGSTLPSYDI